MNRPRALIFSALLHLAVFGGSWISFSWFNKPVPIEVTPVTLMTADEVAKLMAAEASETPAPAAVEDPEPVAEPLPPAPVTAPTPKPAPAPAAPAPKPAPTPTPAPKLAAKAPTPKVPTPAAPKAKTGPMNLDALADSLAKSQPKAGGSPRVAAAKGPSRAETDLSARIAEGQARATSQTALNRLVDQLNRAWRPSCGSDGAPNVTVRLRISESGKLIRAELVDFRNSENPSDIADPAVRAAATLAFSAASRASPYLGLPPEDYDFWKSVRVVFDGKKACGQ